MCSISFSIFLSHRIWLWVGQRNDHFTKYVCVCASDVPFGFILCLLCLLCYLCRSFCMCNFLLNLICVTAFYMMGPFSNTNRDPSHTQSETVTQIMFHNTLHGPTALELLLPLLLFVICCCHFFTLLDLIYSKSLLCHALIGRRRWEPYRKTKKVLSVGSPFC